MQLPTTVNCCVDGNTYGGHAVVILWIFVLDVPNDQFTNVQMAILGGLVQRSFSHKITRILILNAVDQELANQGVTSGCGFMKGC